MTVIKSQRLTLRPLRMSDAPAIATYLADPAIAGNLARVPVDYSTAHAEAWLRNLPIDPAPIETKFAITEANDEFAGLIGFHEKDGAAVLAYWVGQPYWGRGIMGEAARAVIDWYFTTTNASLIRAGAYHFNTASLAIQRKLGFVETGSAPMYCLAQNKDIENIETELKRTAFYTAISKLT